MHEDDRRSDIPADFPRPPPDAAHEGVFLSKDGGRNCRRFFHQPPGGDGQSEEEDEEPNQTQETAQRSLPLSIPLEGL